MNARAGFTLVELLIVLAILGILMSIGFSSLLRQIRTNEVADGARQFGGDLTVLRDGAQRHSVSSGLNWNTAASGDLTTYTLTNNGQTSSRTVNSKVKITCIEPVATVCTPGPSRSTRPSARCPVAPSSGCSTRSAPFLPSTSR